MNRICKYLVQLKGLVLSQKCVDQSQLCSCGNVLVRSVPCLPHAPAPHSQDCSHFHPVQPSGGLGQPLLPSLFLKTVLLCMITGANANLCWSQLEQRGQQVIPAADVPSPFLPSCWGPGEPLPGVLCHELSPKSDPSYVNS